MSRYTDAVKLQEKLAPQVIADDKFKKLRTACGVDVSYRGQDAHAAAVLADMKTLEVLKHVKTRTKVKIPYVPGLMMLREAKPALSAIKSLKEDYDLLLVDGNGRLHPRRCGLACYLGILLDKPTIGVAKSLLCGKISDKFVTLGDEIVGSVIENNGKKIFVSIGNMISLKTATKITKSLVKEREWMPEPLRLADMYSKEYRKSVKKIE